MKVKDIQETLKNVDENTEVIIIKLMEDSTQTLNIKNVSYNEEYHCVQFSVLENEDITAEEMERDYIMRNKDVFESSLKRMVLDWVDAGMTSIREIVETSKGTVNKITKPTIYNFLYDYDYNGTSYDSLMKIFNVLLQIKQRKLEKLQHFYKDFQKKIENPPDKSLKP